MQPIPSSGGREGKGQRAGTGAGKLGLVRDGAERASHVAAVREVWSSIDRPDLIAKYLDPPG